MLNACKHVIIHCHDCFHYLASVKKTPPHCTPAMSTSRERGDEARSIDMEQFESEGSFDTDDEVYGNTHRPKKMKRRE